MIFIGLGAGNSLLIMRLLKEKLLIDKRVAVIDLHDKNDNDKTYCFWNNNNSEMVEDLKPVISHTYNQIQFSSSKLCKLKNQSYFHVRSIDLYNYIKIELQNNLIPFINDAVIDIKYLENSNKYLVTGKKNYYTTKNIFDSSPKKKIALKNYDISLKQSFIGFNVKLDSEAFVKDIFQMMNFNIEQSGYTQFIYILPFSSKEALIELTRFGNKQLEKIEGEELLKKYIQDNFGNYKVISVEVGCIPMTTTKIPKSTFDGIVNTGYNANLIKPSTGYGFKNMYNFAIKTKNLVSKKGFNGLNEVNNNVTNRFSLYDNLLLIILLKWPNLGKPIFEQLFKSQKIELVLKFLDEQTSLIEDFKIFNSLQKKTFLKALYVYLKSRNYVGIILSFLLIIIFYLLNTLSKEASNLFAYIVVILSMLIIGLPHGAIDHLLFSGKLINNSKYVIKYLALTMLYFILWNIVPIASLMFFIVYSSFHFGETEIEDLNEDLTTLKKYFYSFTVGSAILSFVIFSHLNESLIILNKIGQFGLSESLLKFFTDINMLVLSISAGVMVILSFYLKKRNLILLMIILFSLIKTPLIFAFGLYFNFFHSINATHQMKLKLNINDAIFYKEGMVYTGGAVLIFLIYITFMYFFESESTKYFVSFFYIFIACISLPHIILMHLFYRNNKIKIIAN